MLYSTTIRPKVRRCDPRLGRCDPRLRNEYISSFLFPTSPSIYLHLKLLIFTSDIQPSACFKVQYSANTILWSNIRWRLLLCECTARLSIAGVRRQRVRLALGWGTVSSFSPLSPLPPSLTRSTATLCAGCGRTREDKTCGRTKKRPARSQQPSVYLEPKWLRCLSWNLARLGRKRRDASVGTKPCLGKALARISRNMRRAMRPGILPKLS